MNTVLSLLAPRACHWGKGECDSSFDLKISTDALENTHVRHKEQIRSYEAMRLDAIFGGIESNRNVFKPLQLSIPPF